MSDGTGPEFIVIGSGPAGVSAAIPLVEAGRRVLMIDGAQPSRPPDASMPPDQPWRRMLGATLTALRPDDELSPKLRTPVALDVVGGFQRWAEIAADRFLPLGAMARGGLSQLWGGFVAELDQDDLQGWPVTADELAPSYRVVTERIGISGSIDDDMAPFYGTSGPVLPALPLGPTASALLSRYAAGKPYRDFALGLARNAILTVARGERQACNLSLGCLWGCARGAIYDARQDLATLRRHPNFQLRDGAIATRITHEPDGWAVATTDGAPPLRAPRLLIAAGPLGTLRLAVPLLGLDKIVLRLLNSPVMAIPLLVPRRLGKPAPREGYTLAQLGFRLRYAQPPTHYVTGGLYETTALPPSSFAARLPLGRRAGTAAFRALSPALAIASVYFPGHCSTNFITADLSGDQVRVGVRGDVSDDFAAVTRLVRRRLGAIWRRLGAFALPGTTIAVAGTDAHLGGIFPMGLADAHGTSRYGELNAAPGIHLVDGSVLPSISAKPTTLTIMANADRIGRRLAGLA
ncbi:MAG TPA: FAD-binding protein [Xanthobacteraceae bacterium]|nr:FAD-binding protein [Xanthobacteraceae bacterium]